MAPATTTEQERRGSGREVGSSPRGASPAPLPRLALLGSRRHSRGFLPHQHSKRSSRSARTSDGIKGVLQGLGARKPATKKKSGKGARPGEEAGGGGGRGSGGAKSSSLSTLLGKRKATKKRQEVEVRDFGKMNDGEDDAERRRRLSRGGGTTVVVGSYNHYGECLQEYTMGSDMMAKEDGKNLFRAVKHTASEF